MAKRETYLEPVIEGADSKNTRGAKGARAAALSRGKLLGWLAAVAVVLGICLYVLYSFDRFLIRDPRFVMTGGNDADEVATLEISGIRHASRQAVEAVFTEDLGRSVYSLPVQQRREALAKVDWVKDASVARVWPNGARVKVLERTPVAFVLVAAGRAGLIDEEGVIVPASAAGDFHVPVLKGVRANEPVSVRRDRVKKMREVLAALDSHADKISSINVADMDDVEVALPHDGRMLTLELGNRNFSARFNNFLSYYSRVKAKYPQATHFNLREDESITGSLQ